MNLRYPWSKTHESLKKMNITPKKVKSRSQPLKIQPRPQPGLKSSLEFNGTLRILIGISKPLNVDQSQYKDCATEDCSATLVEIADELVDPPFVQLIAFSVLPLAFSHYGSLGGTVLLRENDWRLTDCSFPRLLIQFLQGFVYWNEGRVQVILATHQVKLNDPQDSIPCFLQPYLLLFVPKFPCFN
ncbi:hypothetical protein H5410_003592 [Solanum commersonii]|uniref:Uncharacterized protein n=1 Tax=Solanum commersonii TaxID=4109 RepID=A0A9J6B5I7_SOLCO|nr:hypothetical protein H5410_003592 [Solanum commersonii]